MVDAEAPPARKPSSAGVAPPSDSSAGSSTSSDPRRPQHNRNVTLTRKLSFPDVDMQVDLVARLRRWMWCWAVVDFDLDTGPNLDNVYPRVRFEPALRANIAFSSLPEGDLPTSRSLTYSWRIPMLRTDKTSDKDRPEYQLPPGGDGFLHGFVWFSQEKNDQIRRGFTQRSLVLLTHLPSLPGLYENILGVVAPLFFKHQGGGMVEAACHNIASWPDPAPGPIELPILGTVLSAELPLGSRPQWPPPPAKLVKRIGSPVVNPTIQSIPASLPLTPLSTALHGVLTFSKILLLWELVLLGEPIIISSPDPRTGAELVHHLRNLIRPISLAGDYRPYFHIHDMDYPRIANPNKPPSGTIVSTTNPLVVSSCKHWPHIIRTQVVKTDDPTVVAGLTSSRKRHVKKDPKAAKAVDKAFQSGDYLACDALIFQHLASLTELFLSPLNRYFGTLSSKDMASLHQPSASRSFTRANFVSSLESHGSQLPLRSTATALTSPTAVTARFYTRFLECANFASWLHERTDLTTEVVRAQYLERLEGADMELWLRGTDGATGRPANEVDDLVRRLESEATLSETSTTASTAGTSRSSAVSGTGTRGDKLRSQAARLRSLRADQELSRRNSLTSGASGASLAGASTDDGSVVTKGDEM